VTNSKRPIRRPEDLRGLNIRVPGISIFAAEDEIPEYLDRHQHDLPPALRIELAAA
jgi:hypothetical protein